MIPKITFKNWFYTFKTCYKEFFSLGLFFGLLICIFLYVPKNTNDNDFNIDTLISDYETENNVTLYPYRKNLIKSKILEQNSTKSEAKRIIKTIADQAPKK